MASDALIAQKAAAFIESLPFEKRSLWDQTLDRLYDNPFPGDGTTVELSFPYPEGTYFHSSNGFWVTFQELNPEVLWIAAIMFASPL